jgi:hypothetical protein
LFNELIVEDTIESEKLDEFNAANGQGRVERDVENAIARFHRCDLLHFW